MPASSLGGSAHAGLEGSCSDWVRSLGPMGGVELLQARFGGRGFAPHRHDTYGVAVTDFGVQTFDYRGTTERSLPGQVTVLHPDERHDGRAGTDGGFGYHIVYVAPAEIGAAVRGITGRPTPLPFVREPVAVSPLLARAVNDAFRTRLEPLARDSLIVRIAEGLVAADPSLQRPARPRLDLTALGRARELLDIRSNLVRSAELEAITGLGRYELARQFRAAYGTSPYRYSVLRRLDFARDALGRGLPIVDVALAAGFADQAHFTRMFTSAMGVPPRRYARLLASRDDSSGPPFLRRLLTRADCALVNQRQSEKNTCRKLELFEIKITDAV
jgi:AraC-like DNA-binding protein